MSYTLVLLLHSFGSACRSNRRRPTIHYIVRSHVSSDADFKRSPLLAGGCSTGKVLACSSVEGHLSEYATIPCLGLPVFLQRCPTIDGGRPLISDSIYMQDRHFLNEGLVCSIHAEPTFPIVHEDWCSHPGLVFLSRRIFC